MKAARKALLKDVENAQRILAAVQLAVLKADHGNGGRAPRVKRKRAEVRRGMGRPCAKPRPRPQAAPQPRPRPAAMSWCGMEVCSPAPLAG
eukprot:11167310-Lingulodinium_polyedra.AAC.1